MNRILVFGKNGQLAYEIQRKLGQEISSLFLDRSQIPFSDKEAILEKIRSFNPTVVINCTAYTAVDKAESQPQECFAVNAQFVGDLAEVSASVGCHLIHFSTDYVFDGTQTEPYTETDITNPLSVYGESKRLGELKIFESAKSATIIRTSWLYSRHGANFVKTMIRLANDERPLKVVEDQVGSPTSAADVAGFVVDVLLKNLNSGVELYHYTNEGQASWNEFAREIALLWNTQQKDIIKIPTSDYPTPAKRPMHSVLSKDKVKRQFKVDIPDWRTSLRREYGTWSSL